MSSTLFSNHKVRCRMEGIAISLVAGITAWLMAHAGWTLRKRSRELLLATELDAKRVAILETIEIERRQSTHARASVLRGD